MTDTDFGNDDLFSHYTGFKATASRRSYTDIEPNITVRDDFTLEDRLRFRPSEYIGSNVKSYMTKSQKAYDSVGLIKQVIDLMGDFASQGIRISHQNKSIERFYRRLWAKVDGSRVSERFLNNLYRLGNVVVVASYGKVSRKDQQNMTKAEKRLIPFNYIFLNPVKVEIDGSYPEIFSGKRKYKLQLSNKIKDAVKSGKAPDFGKMDGDFLLLPEDKTYVYHYKKDDWDSWAKPMIHAILDDIMMYEKMKLADTSALDGAISNIRLWRLGSLEHKIMPKAGAIDKLRDILASNVGGGTMDLVWGPEIDFKESNTQIYKFLGNEKYGPVLSAIYGGIGIPQSLTGSSSQNGGYTNNYLSLKTLIEKLEYGRDILLKFWTEQFEIVAKAMGFKSIPEICFDHMTLSDETAEKNLLKELSDRHILSLETVRERLGESHIVENARIEKEQKDRESGKIPPKADPFHNGNLVSDYVKIGLQKDVLSIEDVTDYKERKPPEGNADLSQPKKVKKNNGRPPFSGDQLPRKKKVVLPRSKAETLLWSMDAQKRISEILNPVLIAQCDKRNLRELTKAEHSELELIKFVVLCGLDPFSEITHETVVASMKKMSKPKDTSSLCKSFFEKNGREPNIEELRQIYCLAYIQ